MQRRSGAGTSMPVWSCGVARRRISRSGQAEVRVAAVQNEAKGLQQTAIALPRCLLGCWFPKTKIPCM